MSRSYEDYTVAVVFAMSFEMSAFRYMLDAEHPRLRRTPGDNTIYTLGEIHGHNVVLACLPGQQGKGAAAIVATHLSRTFPSIAWIFLVGIGGGVPSPKHDIRLGDVVVSMPEGLHGGVVQYDLGKATDGGFIRKGFLSAPPSLVRSAVEQMRSDHMARRNRIPEYAAAMLKNILDPSQYARPTAPDILYEEDQYHYSSDESQSSRISDRPPRKFEEPLIHYGLIASGDSVIKSATERQKAIRDINADVLCFEMEAAGIMTESPCIVIRGISDYADAQKNDQWHYYAACSAAGCTKELLSYLDPLDLPPPHKVTRKINIFNGRGIQQTGSGDISIIGNITI